MSMSMPWIVAAAVAAFLAVNAVTLVLLGSTRARRESVAIPGTPRRPVRARLR